MFKIEYRAVIKFLTKEGHSPTVIKQRLDGVYGESAPSYSTVKEWATLFKLEQETLEDDPRSGRPEEAITPDTIALVEAQVLSDRRLKTKEIAARLDLSKTTIIRILHEHLHMNKVSAIKKKRRGKLTHGVRLLHDNAPVHTATVAKAAVLECGFQEIDHPPYSPDLAPSDYYLFSKLKSDLRGRKFNNDEEVKAAVETHFDTKGEDYFLRGLELLPKRCNKCIDVQEDYIEK
jgi:transposase